MAFAAVGLAGLSAPAARAQAEPTVVVDPGTDLADVQPVRVHWSSFPAVGPTFVRQCKAGSTDINSECTGTLTAGFSGGDGSAQNGYAILDFGDVSSPAQTSFRCDPDNPCELRLDVQDQGASVFTARAPLDASIFSKTFPPCPQGPAPLAGSGASEVGGATEAWIVDVCNPPRSLTVDYSVRSSPNGRREFIDKTADFGVTGSPFTTEELDRLRQDGGRDERFVYIPITAGSFVFAYNFWMQDESGFYKQVQDLCLSAETIARFYNGGLKSLTSGTGEKTAIEKDNDGDRPGEPNYDLPRSAQPRVVGRADASNATLQMTSWFQSDPGAKDAWENDGERSLPGGPTQILPGIHNIDNRTGGRPVAKAVANDPPNPGQAGTPIPGSVRISQDFLFGITDLSTARLTGLPVAKIRTSKNDACVAPTDENVSAAVAAMKPHGDGTRSIDFSIHSPSVYPLPNVNYMIASTDGVASDPSKNDALRSFADYALGDGQAVAAPRGYVPLPAHMVAEGRDALARLPGGPGSAPADADGSTADSGLGNFDTGAGSASAAPSSPLSPSAAPGGVAPGSSGGDQTAGGTGGGGNQNNEDTSGSALTRFLSSDKAIPIIIIALLTLATIFGGPIMRILARRRAGG